MNTLTYYYKCKHIVIVTIICSMFMYDYLLFYYALYIEHCAPNKISRIMGLNEMMEVTRK